MSEPLRLPGVEPPVALIVALADVRTRLDLIEGRLEVLSETIEWLVITVEEQLDEPGRRAA